jgi:hypothetical protein
MFTIIECLVDLMLHKFQTLAIGEGVNEHVLHVGMKWKDLQHCINKVVY